MSAPNANSPDAMSSEPETSDWETGPRNHGRSHKDRARNLPQGQRTLFQNVKRSAR